MDHILCIHPSVSGRLSNYHLSLVTSAVWTHVDMLLCRCVFSNFCPRPAPRVCNSLAAPPVLRTCGVKSRGTAGGAQHLGGGDISQVSLCTLRWLQPIHRGLSSLFTEASAAPGWAEIVPCMWWGNLRPGAKVCSLLAVLQAPFPDQTTAGAGDGVAETAAVGGAFVVSPMFLARPKPSVEISLLLQPFTGVQTGTDPT